MKLPQTLDLKSWITLSGGEPLVCMLPTLSDYHPSMCRSTCTASSGSVWVSLWEVQTSIIIREEASSSMTIRRRKSNRSLGDVCSWTSTFSKNIRYPPLTQDQTISMSYWFHSQGCHISSTESSVSHMQRGKTGRTRSPVLSLGSTIQHTFPEKCVGESDQRSLYHT